MKAATILDLKHGLMADFSNEKYPCQVYGVIGGNGNGKGNGVDGLILPHGGTAYGFVQSGNIHVLGSGHGGSFMTPVTSNEYFSAPGKNGIKVLASKDARAFFAYRLDFMGLRHLGGPVEQIGRLKYIDGCSDTLLIPPPLLGDPCFNLLHFPAGITQTKHTHPTVRCGLIHGGKGRCITEDGEEDLLPGRMFILAPDAIHAFVTEGSSMDLTVFHPDTDFGPTHENHPMLNRTIVDGISAKSMDEIRTKEIRQ
jgi:quercetin dioxygenase-like cupin family protein